MHAPCPELVSGSGRGARVSNFGRRFDVQLKRGAPDPLEATCPHLVGLAIDAKDSALRHHGGRSDLTPLRRVRDT